MATDHQTSLLLSEEQRARWDKYVGENPDFSSKADLIRRAVEKEINNDDEEDAQVANSEAISEVQDELRQLRTLVEDLQTTVEAVEARTREPTQDIKELTNEIFAVLPEGQDHIWEWERGRIQPNTGHEPEPTAHSGTLTAISNVLSEEEYRIQQALDELQDNSHRVQTVEIADKRRWYKEV